MRANIYNGIVRLSGFMLVLVVPAIMGWNNPDIDNDMSICPFMRFLSIPCPGCGLTKSMIHAYNGELLLSLHYHWWGIPLIIIIISLMITQVNDMIMNHLLTDKILSNTALWQTIAFMVVITYVIRLVLYLV